MHDTKKLTGNKRYRIQSRIFRKALCVLQVEEDHRWYTDCGTLRRDVYWRDAVVEDLTNVTD